MTKKSTTQKARAGKSKKEPGRALTDTELMKVAGGRPDDWTALVTKPTKPTK